MVAVMPKMRPMTDFSVFFHQHHALVRKVIFQIAGRRLSAAALEDGVQEAFIRIWKGLAEFRGEAQITSWVYRISTNVALDLLRAHKSRREETVDSESQSDIADDHSSVEDAMSARDLVSQGLSSLGEDQRTVLILALLHERPLAEIAETLKIPEGTVKSRLHAARAAFIQFLASKGVSL